MAFYRDAPFLIWFESVQAAQEGRFSGAGMADDAEDFSPVDGHVDVVKHLVRAKIFGQF